MSQNNPEDKKDVTYYLSEIFKKQTELYEKLLECYKYIPYIYDQINSTTQKDGLFLIDYNNSSIPRNCIIYMLPKCNSNNTYKEGEIKETKLKVVFSRHSGGAIKDSKEYLILCENANGTLSKCSTGSITAGRVAQFRFPEGTDYCILLNNPIHNSLKVNELEATYTNFGDIPTVKVKYLDGEEQKEKICSMGLKEDIMDLTTRIEKLEDKFRVGTDKIEDVVDDLPDGAFYIQIEEEEV